MSGLELLAGYYCFFNCLLIAECVWLLMLACVSFIEYSETLGCILVVLSVASMFVAIFGLVITFWTDSRSLRLIFFMGILAVVVFQCAVIALAFTWGKEKGNLQAEKTMTANEFVYYRKEGKISLFYQRWNNECCESEQYSVVDLLLHTDLATNNKTCHAIDKDLKAITCPEQSKILHYIVGTVVSVALVEEVGVVLLMYVLPVID